jgi:hypothetical protein
MKNSASKKINILPSGTLTYTIANEETVKNEKNNTLYNSINRFTGLGGPPAYTWFTKDGNFFGNLSDWISLSRRL